MIEVADILRLHGSAFRQQKKLSAFELKVLEDIEYCRTPYFGGYTQQCDRCDFERSTYHSCLNRHCPKCHGQQAQRWLERQGQSLLPVSYYFLTFTLPQELRPLVRAHPRLMYGLLLTLAVAALQKLAWDPQWVGGQLAILAVLHTWTRAMLFHPHVHLLVPAGGLTKDGAWRPAQHSRFLVPDYALSEIFRAKMKAALKKRGWLNQVPPSCWQKSWNVHCRHAGSGQKVLDYLARYVFRVAITNSRIEQFQNGQVTFRYRDNKTQQLKRVQLPALQFLERFIDHILPRGFVKVRSYGLWNANSKHSLQKIRQQLAPDTPSAQPEPVIPSAPSSTPPFSPLVCPKCKCGYLCSIQILPQRNRPP